MEDHSFLFAVNMRWRCTGPSPQLSEKEKAGASEPAAPETHPEPASIWSAKSWRKQPQVLGKLDLEITLERSLAKTLAGERMLATFAHMNERRLSDAACRPKSFRVTVEKGNFVPTTHVGIDRSIGKQLELRYGLRLVFDRTLAPPWEEFTDPNEWIVSDGGWWRITDYVARQLPKSEYSSPAMNDSAWDYYVRSCVVS